jgi:SAM-dependent methyltransferase
LQNYLPKIRDQYERYPFPVRAPELEADRLIISEIDHLRKIDHHCFGGRRDFDQPMRILVAGGGTGDALIFLAEQLRGKPVEFVFLDMSIASLEIAQKRAEARDLTNTHWIHGSLLELDPENVGVFDYINCVGVLHHLAEPHVGLAKLKSVLAPGGGIGLMLYGKYGRHRVYLIQELLGLMMHEETPLDEQLSTTRDVLSSLIRSKALGASSGMLEVIEDPQASSYLVDTYLHGQDRAYSYSDISELLANCGLRHAGFTNFFEEQGASCALEYDPLLFFNDPAQAARVSSLPFANRAHIAELLGGSTSMHAFYASDSPSSGATPLELDLAPFTCTGYGRRVIDGILADGLDAVPIRLNCGVLKSLDVDDATRSILRCVDQDLSVREIIASLGTLPNSADATARTIALLDLLVNLGLVTLRQKGLPTIAAQPSVRAWNSAIDLRSFEKMGAGGC